MKKALIVLFFVALALVSSTTSLGISVCETSSEKTATMQSIMVYSSTNSLVVTVKPTSSVQADFTYDVDLYEKGSRRGSETVVWNRIEANTQETKSVSFPLSSEEASAYVMLTQSQLRKTFSIKVHE
jgi:hypothetical protein